VGTQHWLAFRPETGERRVGVHPAGQSCEPIERVAGGRELERTRLRKAHRRWDRACQVKTEDRVSELAGGTGRPAVDPPAEHESASDTRTDGQHDQVSGDKLELLVVRLGKRCDVGVVVDEHGNTKPLSQHLTEGNVGERHVNCTVRYR
jgi:hypothetical protein